MEDWNSDVVLDGFLLFLGLLHVLHACKFVRTSQGAGGWSILLVLLPEVGIPAYWIFGPWKFRDFREIRDRRLRLNGASQKPELPKEIEGSRTGEFLRMCTELSPLRPSNQNSLTIVTQSNFFDELDEIIASANNYLLIQFFIFRSDELGEKVVSALQEAAKRGVKVFVLLDGIGGRRFFRKRRRQLEDYNIYVTLFLTAGGSFLRQFRINFCNHRKIVVADGKVAVTGGMNVGKEYSGHDEAIGYWRDTAVRLEGPVVRELEIGFLIDWECSSQIRLEWLETILEQSGLPESLEEEHGREITVPVYTSPIGSTDEGVLFLCSAIESAQKRFWISTPYFVPPESILAALQRAVLRGVDVKVIIPGVADYTVLYMANAFYAVEASEREIPVYRYERGFIHQKVMLADTDWASIGTHNLDNRSLYWNFEVSIVSTSSQFVFDVEKMLQADLQECEALSRTLLRDKGVIFRTGAQITRLGAGLL